MPGQKNNVISFPDAQFLGGSGGSGGGGDKYLYEKVDKLEGTVSGLATKQDVEKIKTDVAKSIGDVNTEIANSIGKAKSWFFWRLSIILASALVLVGGGLFAFFKWSFGPFLEKLLKSFLPPPGT